MDEKLIRNITQRVLAEMAGIPLGVSARHVHICRAHMDVLFGPGSSLTFKKALMAGEFAAEECVTLVGVRALEKVRILGPFRPATQVEVSRTDARLLGVSPPLRDSGDLAGSGAITLVGPKGALYLPEGCIVARRHIHMPPESALALGLQDRAEVSVRIGGPRSAVLENVPVRVAPGFELQMHLDTDEANAFDVKTGDLAGVVV